MYQGPCPQKSILFYSLAVELLLCTFDHSVDISYQTSSLFGYRPVCWTIGPFSGQQRGLLVMPEIELFYFAEEPRREKFSSLYPDLAVFLFSTHQLPPSLFIRDG